MRSIPTFRQGRGSGILLLALLFAIAAGVLTFFALNDDDGGGEEASAAETVKVVVAAEDISAPAKLKEDMLDVVEVPADKVISGAFDDTESLEGQTSRYPILKGEQVTALKVGLGKDEDEESLALVLPEGMRAFSIQVSEESGVGGLILPGDFVDVVGILDARDVALDKAVTLLQNAEVLAVAQEAQEPIPPASEADADSPTTGTLGERPEDVEPNPDAQTVTLAVTQEQAQLLALVQSRGELVLSLRSFGDRAVSELVPSDLQPYGAVPEDLNR